MRDDLRVIGVKDEVCIGADNEIFRTGRYIPNTDVFKVDDNDVVHTLKGINFNMACLGIMKELLSYIEYESPHLGKEMRKEIAYKLNMNL